MEVLGNIIIHKATGKQVGYISRRALGNEKSKLRVQTKFPETEFDYIEDLGGKIGE